MSWQLRKYQRIDCLVTTSNWYTTKMGFWKPQLAILKTDFTTKFTKKYPQRRIKQMAWGSLCKLSGLCDKKTYDK
jgi:hypothetical protein